MNTNIVGLFGNVPKTKPEAAEFYTKKGWRILPLNWMYDGGDGVLRCSCDKPDCKMPGKHPLVELLDKEAMKARGDGEKVYTATSDPKIIKRWWKKWPEANIGFWLEGSGLAALDVDVGGEKKGHETLREIMDKAGATRPDTLVAKTPSGGAHIYFLDRPDLPNKSNALGMGLDIWRGQHYLLLPPSNHKAGGLYTWEKLAAPVAWPDWLMPKKPTMGRPVATGKETFDPYSKRDVGKLLYDLSFCDASDRETWINVGVVMGRAFRRSPEGLQHYIDWAKTTTRGNFDAKLSEKAYMVDSQNPPSGSPLTTAYIHGLATKAPSWKPYDEARDPRERFEQHDGFLSDTLRDLNDTLLRASVPFYQREGKIIDVVSIASLSEAERLALYNATGVDRPRSYCITREMSPGHFAVKVSEKVKWFKPLKGKLRLVDPDRILCHDYLHNPDVWIGIPIFKAFVPHPTVRSLSDPHILTQNGYDATSGLYLDTHLQVGLPHAPGLKEAQAALHVLLSPFEHYKFTEGQGKAALLAMLLTVGVRHALDKSPMFMITSPVVGSGKTKLAECASTLWYGEPAAVMVMTDNEEENEKRIGGCAMAGDRVVVFDNISLAHSMNDRTLAALLTSGRIQFRVMGGQDIARMAFPATIIGTGNNVVLGRDLARRVVRIDIDPESPTPTARVFPFEPVEFVRRHRVKLMEAALTILTAYFASGRIASGALDTIPSFDQWGAIADCCQWLGLPNPYVDPNTLPSSHDTGHAALCRRLCELIVDVAPEAATYEPDRGGVRISKLVPLLEAREEWREWFNDALMSTNYGYRRDPKSNDYRTLVGLFPSFAGQNTPSGRLLFRDRAVVSVLRVRANVD